MAASRSQVLSVLAKCFEEHREKHPGYYVGYATAEQLAVAHVGLFEAGELGVGEVGKMACRRLGIPGTSKALRVALSS